VPNFLGAEMKIFNLYKFSGQPKILKLENIFQASWKIFSQEFFRIPNFLGGQNGKKKILRCPNFLGSLENPLM